MWIRLTRYTGALVNSAPNDEKEDGYIIHSREIKRVLSYTDYRVVVVEVPDAMLQALREVHLYVTDSLDALATVLQVGNAQQ